MLYGPYADLEPGSYEMCFHTSSQNVGMVAMLDVVSDVGRLTHHVQELKSASSDIEIIQFRIDLPQGAKRLEIRFFPGAPVGWTISLPSIERVLVPDPIDAVDTAPPMP